MRNKKKSGNLLIILGCCCFMAAAALYGYNAWVSNRAAMASSRLTEALDSLMQTANSSQSGNELDSMLGDSASGSSEDSIPSLRIKGYDTIGIISLPTINIRLAVLSKWSYPNLNISACRYSGTPDGQLVLLAHDFKRHFGLIYKLKPGDPVQFTAANGVVYNYKVTGTEIRGKYQLQEILSGNWDLTLFTCTYGGKNRVVVRCKRTE